MLFQSIHQAAITLHVTFDLSAVLACAKRWPLLSDHIAATTYKTYLLDNQSLH